MPAVEPVSSSTTGPPGSRGDSNPQATAATTDEPTGSPAVADSSSESSGQSSAEGTEPEADRRPPAVVGQGEQAPAAPAVSASDDGDRTGTGTATPDKPAAGAGTALPGGLRPMGAGPVGAGPVGADSATLRIDAPGSTGESPAGRASGVYTPYTHTSGTHPPSPTAHAPWPGTPTTDLGERSGSGPHTPVPRGRPTPGPGTGGPGRPSARPVVDTSRERSGVTPLTWAFILLTIAAIVLGVIVIRNALLVTQPGIGPGPAGMERPGEVEPTPVPAALSRPLNAAHGGHGRIHWFQRGELAGADAPGCAVTDLTSSGKPSGTSGGSTSCPLR